MDTARKEGWQMKFVFEQGYTGVPEEGYFQEGCQARFVNSGGIAMTIVAVLSYNDGRLMDWAAYWGGSRFSKEIEVCHDIAEYGCKLSREDAFYFFKGKQFPKKKYRG